MTLFQNLYVKLFLSRIKAPHRDGVWDVGYSSTHS